MGHRWKYRPKCIVQLLGPIIPAVEHGELELAPVIQAFELPGAAFTSDHQRPEPGIEQTRRPIFIMIGSRCQKRYAM